MAFADKSKHKARAFGQVVLGMSKEKRTPFIEYFYRVSQGENEGGEVRWTGYFGPKSSERTIESMQASGWEGDDIGEFADGELHGLDTNEVEIVIELEEYKTSEGEKRVAPRVAFVNSLGGYLNVQNAMAREEAERFGAKMRGLVLKAKAKKGVPSAADAEFNYGANEKSGPATKGW